MTTVATKQDKPTKYPPPIGPLMFSTQVEKEFCGRGWYTLINCFECFVFSEAVRFLFDNLMSFDLY